MKILHLHTNWKWYDKIDQGEKLEEYRDLKWLKTACKYGFHTIGGCSKFTKICRKRVPTDYTHVCIWKGYTKENMLFTIDKMTIGIGNPEWGAPDYDVLIIKLKERVGIYTETKTTQND